MLAVEHRGIRHRYIKPRRPDQNGKVERSHRVDGEEFWDRRTFASFEAAAAALARVGARVQRGTVLTGVSRPHPGGETRGRSRGRRLMLTDGLGPSWPQLAIRARAVEPPGPRESSRGWLSPYPPRQPLFILCTQLPSTRLAPPPDRVPFLTTENKRPNPYVSRP